MKQIKRVAAYRLAHNTFFNTGDMVDTISDILFLRLKRKGLNEVETARLLLDIQRLKENEKVFIIDSVKRKITGLGWAPDIIDHYIFELIVSFLEDSADSNQHNHMVFQYKSRHPESVLQHVNHIER